MPVGLPQLSSAPGQCRFLAAQAANAWRDFLVYLDLPSAAVYWNSCRMAYNDVRVATSSVGSLGYLTFKPILLIVWLVLQYLWKLLQFLCKHLFHHAYESTKKGAVQLKWATNEFIKWQSSLSNKSVAIEICVVAALIGCYMLRRYIEKRKYVQRATSWYRHKKRSVKESYRRGVRRIADTSLFLAMLMPHVVFLAAVASAKLLMPRLLTYLANETYILSLVSFCYPMMWTIGLLQWYRNGPPVGKENTAPESPKGKKKNGQQLKTPKRRRSSFFPRTTPTRSVQRWLIDATTPVRCAVKKDDPYDMNEDANYWLQYWFVYSLLLAFCRLTFLLPVMGRFIGKYALLSSSLRELQLVFFLWIFGVPLVTPELTNETRPIPLLYQRAVPVVVSLYNHVSQAIQENLWQAVVQKVGSVLDVAILVKLISTDTKDLLVHLLEESRPVLPPAITLFMPGFLTEYGVVYVKTLVPSAKCCQAKTLDETMSWLEYWVLHGLLAVLLTWWAPFLWWIPFSTHGIFLLWCNLQIPKTTRKWYNVFEEELQALGLLEKGDKDLQVERTLTASMLRKLASSLPSASDVANAERDSQKEEQVEKQQEEGSDGNPLMINADQSLGCDDMNDGTTSQARGQQGVDSDSSLSSGDYRGGNVTTRRRSTRLRGKQTVN